MKVSKKKKVIVLIVVLLSVVLLIPWTIRSVRSVKKIEYIVDLMTGKKAEEETTTDKMITAFINKRNPRIYRKYAASKLGHTLKDPKAVEPLIKVLQDKTEHELIRAEAAFTLGLIGDTRAIEPLIEALNDESYEVQIHVLRGLVKFKDERIVKPLLAVTKSEDPKKRAIATTGLKINTPEVVATLIKLIKEDPYFYSKYDAVESLGETRTRNEEAFQILLEVLDGKYVEKEYDSGDRDLLISTAILALGKIGDKRAVEPLLKILEDDPIRYLEAAIALGNIGDRRALAPLRKRMEEKKHKEWVMKDLNEACRKLTER